MSEHELEPMSAEHELTLDLNDTWSVSTMLRLRCLHGRTHQWHGYDRDPNDPDSWDDECALLTWWENVEPHEIILAEDGWPQNPTFPLLVTADGWGDDAPEIRYADPEGSGGTADVEAAYGDPS